MFTTMGKTVSNIVKFFLALPRLFFFSNYYNYIWVQSFRVNWFSHWSIQYWRLWRIYRCYNNAKWTCKIWINIFSILFSPPLSEFYWTGWNFFLFWIGILIFFRLFFYWQKTVEMMGFETTTSSSSVYSLIPLGYTTSPISNVFCQI